MTDERLRELEQRWKASCSPEDEAAYLLERVRSGDLEKEKLELAAYCGHEGARLALGDEAPEVPEDLEEWVRSLSPTIWPEAPNPGERHVIPRLAAVVANLALESMPPDSTEMRLWGPVARGILPVALSGEDDPKLTQVIRDAMNQQTGWTPPAKAIYKAASVLWSSWGFCSHEATSAVQSARMTVDDATLSAALREEALRWCLG